MQQHLAMVTGLLEQTTGLQQRASALLPALERGEEAHEDALHDDAGDWTDAENSVHFAGVADSAAEAAAQQQEMEVDALVGAEASALPGQREGAPSREAPASSIALEEHAEFEDAHEELTTSVVEPSAEKVIFAASSWSLLVWAGCPEHMLQHPAAGVPRQRLCRSLGLEFCVPSCRLLWRR